MNLKNFADFLSRLEPVPDDWYTDKARARAEETKREETPAIEPLECTSYADLLEVWQLAVKWDYAVDVTFTSMLATVASTMMPSEQLWLRVIGRPGTLKTTLSAALAGCKQYVFDIEKFKGIHSGWIGKNGEAGKDHSLIPMMNHKTSIINEADTLLKAPNLPEILSELRALFSGKTKADYRHGKHEEYADLRTSLILCGTPIVRRLNRSAAGDRFLDSIIHEKRTAQEETNIVRSVVEQDYHAMLRCSNGEAVETRNLSKEMLVAYRKTVGYVIYLRENADRLLKRLQTGERKVLPSFTNDCESLGHLVARMRTRPSGEDEEETEAEFHVRLSKQLMKLGIATSVVLDRDIDNEVMRRVARVARDTCYGDVFNVAKALLGKARPDRAVMLELGYTNLHRVNRAITVLKAVECIKVELDKITRGRVLRLSPLCTNLLTRLKVLLGSPKVLEESSSE